MEAIRKSITWVNGETLTIETGRLARQADGAIILSIGETVLLATVVANKDIKPDIDFLPLSVDYRENYSSTGRIPGGFFKRDGRLNEYEVLTSRVVDRSLRPLFPEDYHGDIQVLVTLLSSDREEQADALALVAASSAICISDIPFQEPVASVRVVYKNGNYQINPKFSEMNGVELDLIIAATQDSIVMVEGEMVEVSEEIMMGAFKEAHEYIRKLIALQNEMRTTIGKTTREYDKPLQDPELKDKVFALTAEKVKQVYANPTSKQERKVKLEEIRQEVLALYAEHENIDAITKLINNYYDDVKSHVVRMMILDENKRIDGRKCDEIRPIWCEVSYLKRCHGSAIFTRGETQSLTTVTLGSKLDEQLIDYATIQGTKKFMLQYNFPPFSTGEIKPLRAPARREVGHGNLAERALKVMAPDDNEYTIRVVSDILESNGSSSMATVCAGSLALMDAGVKIKAPVSGIAMGLIVEGDRYAVLSDILGDEDHLGDMDFKVCGTTNGLTACQMDIKVRGLSYEILSKALEQARNGRNHILGKMLEVLAEPRPEISDYAPRIVKMIIPTEFIGAVIGPGGKIIQEIQRTTGATVNIEEANGVGNISIASPVKENIDAAVKWIKGIVQVPEVGELYKGKVKNIVAAGAFVEFINGKDGWLHISELSENRVGSVDEVVSIGDEIDVRLIEVDAKAGKFRLSIRAVNETEEEYTERVNANKSSGGGRGGDRGGDRGGRFNNDRGGGGGRSDYRNDRGGDRGDRGGDRGDRGGGDRRDRGGSFNDRGNDRGGNYRRDR